MHQKDPYFNKIIPNFLSENNRENYVRLNLLSFFKGFVCSVNTVYVQCTA